MAPKQGGLERGQLTVGPGFVAAAVIAVAAAAAYARTFSVPFLLDDGGSIVSNASIRHWSTALKSPLESTSNGRPILNLSLALNYAVSGLQPWSYHVFNVVVHILSGWTLFGIVRRTVERPVAPAAWAVSAPLERTACGAGASPALFACCVALVWTLHPLQTESVTYVIQRAESLAGLFYLLTLYCFVRFTENPADRVNPAEAGSSGGPRRGVTALASPNSGRIAWAPLATMSCLMGMATKEIVATAPLIIFLYDRTFVSHSFAGAWRKRRVFYSALASTWILLVSLVVSSHGRNQTAGFESGVPWWDYALTQFPAIVHYLKLCFWPHPLVFDYGSSLAPASLSVAASFLLVAALLAITVWALFRNPVLGFLGACFFAILAPSSSIIPVASQTMAEHRMYLPLIPVVVLAVLVLNRWLGRAAAAAVLCITAGLFAVTWARNEDYQSALKLWTQTIAVNPGTSRGQNNLGIELVRVRGRELEAIAHYQEALRLDPKLHETHDNLGDAFSRLPGRLNDAVAEYQAALALKPDYPKAHNNLGNAYLRTPGRLRDAVSQFQEALRLQPDFAEAHNNLGMAILQTEGGIPNAITQFQEALRLDPDFAAAHQNLGTCLAQTPGRMNEAIREYEAVLRLKPDSPVTHHNLAIAYAQTGRTAEALQHLKAALRLNPNYEAARRNLETLEAMQPH